jgi:DNA-binding CsgD family transcriptional regulator
LAALALARRLDDPEALFRSAYWVMASATVPQLWGERLQLAQEFSIRPREGVTNRTLGVLLWVCGCVLLAGGHRSEAQTLWRPILELAAREQTGPISMFAFRSQVIPTIIDGHLDEALILFRRFVERADENGTGIHARMFSLVMLLYPALHLGRATVWLTALEENTMRAVPSSMGAAAENAARAVCLAELGRVPEARELAEPWLTAYANASDEDATGQTEMVLLLCAAVRLGHPEATRVLSERLACVVDVCIVDDAYTCVARHLGDASVLLGDRASARTYYAQALEAAGKIRFRPELALTHLRLAELLIEEPDDAVRPEALDHLDIAIPELQDMKMQPTLERALALRESLAPATEQSPGRESASEVLTTRERQIAGLMADGLSNHDIAERLVISEGTVEVHVKHILGKLGIRSRAQVAGWLARQAPG